MRATLILLATLLAAVLAAATPPARAASNLPDGAERVLADHGFLPSRFLGDPWVGSYFSSHVGAGSAVGIDKTLYDLDGNPLTTISGSVASTGPSTGRRWWSRARAGTRP